MSYSRHSCRSKVFANTPEAVCFLPLVCGCFLAAIRANMQSHPLYLIPALFPAAPRIALFQAITGTCAPILTDSSPGAGRGACPQRAEYLAPICPTSPPGTKPPGNDAQRVPRRCVRAPPAKARAPGSPPTSPMMSLGLHPPGHRPLHGDHRPATPTLPIGWTRPILRSPAAT